ncbi:protein xylosyltransferase [Aureococcus anophagefferens]|uniref:Protein xylosyltransferase n=1 Tax=Aureococcus anophagefferens TaxID=44056 RepID=A0ABR1G2M9_AURAN
MNRGALAYAASDLAAAVGFLERAVFANPGNGAALENLRVAQETAHRGRARRSRAFDAAARDRGHPRVATAWRDYVAYVQEGEPAALLRAGDGAPWPSAAALRRDLDARGRAPRRSAAGSPSRPSPTATRCTRPATTLAPRPRTRPRSARRGRARAGRAGRVLPRRVGPGRAGRRARGGALRPRGGARSGLAAAWNNLGILKLHGDDVEDGVRCLGEAARLDGAAYGPNRAFAARFADRSRELAAPVFAAERRVDVVTTLYAAPAPRGGELLEALGRNAALASVRALRRRRRAPRRGAAAGAKVAVVGAAGQPDYAALFAVAGDQRGPVALAHADVYFDDSLGCAADLLAKLPRPTLLAVTRRPEPRCVEASGGGHAPGLPLDLCAPQGHWAGEAVHGYDAFVFLPPRAAVVAAFHLHCSRQRTYAFNATVRDLGGAPVDVFKLSHRRFHGARAKAPPARRRAAPRRVVPRSGSSMLRARAERATGLWTGRRTTTRRSSPGATRARASAGPRCSS